LLDALQEIDASTITIDSGEAQFLGPAIPWPRRAERALAGAPGREILNARIEIKGDTSRKN